MVLSPNGQLLGVAYFDRLNQINVSLKYLVAELTASTFRFRQI